MASADMDEAKRHRNYLSNHFDEFFPRALYPLYKDVSPKLPEWVASVTEYCHANSVSIDLLQFGKHRANNQATYASRRGHWALGSGSSLTPISPSTSVLTPAPQPSESGSKKIAHKPGSGVFTGYSLLPTQDETIVMNFAQQMGFTQAKTWKELSVLPDQLLLLLKHFIPEATSYNDFLTKARTNALSLMSLLVARIQ